jgi:hypothetical protein
MILNQMSLINSTNVLTIIIGSFFSIIRKAVNEYWCKRPSLQAEKFSKIPDNIKSEVDMVNKFPRLLSTLLSTLVYNPICRQQVEP